MKLYMKVIRPYLKGYKEKHGVDPECLKDYNGKWFDESLKFEIMRDVARRLSLDSSGDNFFKQATKLTNEYNLCFEERDVELITIPKDGYLQGRVISDIEEFRSRMLMEGEYVEQSRRS